MKKAKAEIIDMQSKGNELANEENALSFQDAADRLISRAIDKKVPAETMEKLLSMRRELKAEWAKEQYNKAMSAFQLECPVIEKKKEAKDGTRVLYKYAPVDDALVQKADTGETVAELIAKHGFSYTFRQENDGAKVKVHCIISHIAGHSETSTMETGLTNKTGIMSGPQQIAATVTFNKRYSFFNGFGIMTGYEDVDASRDIVEDQEVPQRAPQKPPQQPAESVYIRKAQVDEINSLMASIPKEDRKNMMENIIERDINDFKLVTQKEADMIIEELKKQPVKSEQPQQEDLAAMAMNCKTQEEAKDIVIQATLDKNITETKITAIKSILSTRGFTV